MRTHKKTKNFWFSFFCFFLFFFGRQLRVVLARHLLWALAARVVVVADAAGRLWVPVVVHVVVVARVVARTCLEVLAAVDARVLAAQVLLVLGVAAARVPPAPRAVGAVLHARTNTVLDAEVARGAHAVAVGRGVLAGRTLVAGAVLLAQVARGADAATLLLLAAVGGLVAVLADHAHADELLLGFSCGLLGDGLDGCRLGCISRHLGKGRRERKKEGRFRELFGVCLLNHPKSFP